ncbi:MAG: malto-oligosyltrehalose trehalohydrolase [Rhodospirillales bacterium]|nr:malto-oligosyltrehalose trehalohydrolase [Rhodospirillales bacterium]
MPFGAAIEADGRVRFRLWAPAAKTVDVALTVDGRRRTLPMAAAGDGWFDLHSDACRPGDKYVYLIDGKDAVPDPASRFQPEDVHGPSEIVDPDAFDWPDDDWRGRPWEEAVIYELHVGSFTPEGSYAGAMAKLDHLAALGVTAIELMPLAESPGGHNWGYDGVEIFAPEERYGRPEDLKALIAAAHARGLMVLLDVVYNHFGPEGNYLHRYAPQFFNERHHTPWGAAINFDAPGSRTVRDFYIHNALYWLNEYHFDGLRFDAVHTIADDGQPHFLDELAARIAAACAGRQVHLVLENDDNNPHYLERDGEGRPRTYTAQWNDDVHHALHAAIAGETKGYYADYADDPVGHLGRALTQGFAYQGESSAHRGGRERGRPSGHLPPTAFVSFLQNHDQVGNRAFGDRITGHVPAAAVCAAAAIILLAPSPPMLFMGEEWGAKEPFPFFCDFEPGLADSVREGRRREFARFPEFADPAARARIPDPVALSTFASAALDWGGHDISPHGDWLAFYRGLIDLRRREIVPRLRDLTGNESHYRTNGEGALFAEWRLADGAKLNLIAGLIEKPLTINPVGPPGRLIFSTAPDEARRTMLRTLPAWFVAWYLDGGKERA